MLIHAKIMIESFYMKINSPSLKRYVHGQLRANPPLQSPFRALLGHIVACSTRSGKRGKGNGVYGRSRVKRNLLNVECVSQGHEREHRTKYD